MSYCDLHVHSTFSDGTCTPAELIVEAQAAGLRAMALTDHNTVDGLRDFNEAAKRTNITPVNGCEFTSELYGKELHIVGLFLPEACWADVRTALRRRNELKDISNRQTIDRLRDAGYDISYDEILSAHPGIMPNRVHIAEALVGKGYVSSNKEAFDRYLEPEHGFFVETPKTDAREIVRLIRAWKGVAVWAHPLLKVSRERIPEFLEELTAAGLDAVETRYSDYQGDDERFMDEMAARFGLLSSGGSDFHGSNKPHIRLGSGMGMLNVTEEMFDALRALAEERRS